MYGFLLVFFSNFVPKMHCFSDILLQKCRDLENQNCVRGPSRSLEISPFDRVHTTSYWRSIVIMALSRVVSEISIIQCRKMSWPWNPGLRSLNVIKNDTSRSGTHDFLLTFHSNHRPISHHFLDKRRFPSKITNFSHPHVFNAPAEGAPLGIGYRCKKAPMMGLPDGQKK